MPVGNVLVGTEFSASAELAVERAARLPIARGSSISLVHVLPQRPSTRHSERFVDAAAQRLAAAQSQLRGRQGAPTDVFTAVLSGNPADELCRRAHDERAELIVVGRGGGARKAPYGSIAAQVARIADCSVLVVNRPTERPYARPLVGLDRSDRAAGVLAYAARICAGAPLTIVHAHLSYGAELFPLSLDVNLSAGEIEEYERAAEREVRPQIESAVHAVLSDSAGEVVLAEGDPRDAILDEAQRRAADVIIVGTTGHSRIARILLGSVADELLRIATCDVLLVR